MSQIDSPSAAGVRDARVSYRRVQQELRVSHLLWARILNAAHHRYRRRVSRLAQINPDEILRIGNPPPRFPPVIIQQTAVTDASPAAR